MPICCVRFACYCGKMYSHCFVSVNCLLQFRPICVYKMNRVGGRSNQLFSLILTNRLLTMHARTTKQIYSTWASFVTSPTLYWVRVKERQSSGTTITSTTTTRGWVRETCTASTGGVLSGEGWNGSQTFGSQHLTNTLHTFQVCICSNSKKRKTARNLRGQFPALVAGLAGQNLTKFCCFLPTGNGRTDGQDQYGPNRNLTVVKIIFLHGVSTINHHFERFHTGSGGLDPAPCFFSYRYLASRSQFCPLPLIFYWNPESWKYPSRPWSNGIN